LVEAAWVGKIGPAIIEYTCFADGRIFDFFNRCSGPSPKMELKTVFFL
jgi:hypothetical protein